ncbi:MAG TPA: hypothetical protein VFN75_04605 [Pseudonocardiaceae bacterium]|nr:hypothetical protein [Pseudonocardiaceae bacterium]
MATGLPDTDRGTARVGDDGHGAEVSDVHRGHDDLAPVRDGVVLASLVAKYTDQTSGMSGLWLDMHPAT